MRFYKTFIYLFENVCLKMTIFFSFQTCGMHLIILELSQQNKKYKDQNQDEFVFL